MDPRPCVSLDDLFAWQPPGGAARQEVCIDEGDDRLPCNPTAVPPIVELKRSHTLRRHPQFLVCHDFRGDFPVCDRWEGAEVSEGAPLLFTHLWHIDTLCYFGHKMVTIPPPAYTSLAHRHGVAVQGTIIFEHEFGSEQLSRILATEQSMARTIDQLCAIMKTWRFDGWLVNVEVAMEVREIPLLLDFLRKLRAATKATNNYATVLWYDAVCLDGKLEWQNTINNRNREFYDVCDGIFTNYEWKAKDLEATNTKWYSSAYARDPFWTGLHVAECRYNRGAATVCIGIDVYGRSGGSSGWNTCEMVAKVFKKGLSVALFAPGWAVEAAENQYADAEENSLKFWNCLSHVMNTRPINIFPFKSTFRNGYSEDGKFFRLRDMDLMPHLAHSKRLLVPTARGLLIKAKGEHLLWAVSGMRSHSMLRIKIAYEGTGAVTIKLGRREMRMERINDDGTRVFRPATDECMQLRVIYVVTSEPDSLLTYFEAYNVETALCLN